tara:strand:- start:618 stop:1622 length:1005 start_codon:yes stop_codon:yes gene_type:complete
MSSVSDYSLANQGFSAFRTELNNILGAINTTNLATSAPASLAAGSMWVDSSSAGTHTVKYYDGSDSITLFNINTSANTVDFIDSSVTTELVNDTSPQLGGNLDTNSHNIIIDDAHFISDENNNEQIIFQTTASAVNELEITNGATGNPPILGASGETNVDLHIKPKGSGETIIGSGGAAATLTTSGTYDLVLDTNKGTNSGNITITDGANGNIDITTNGTGAIKFNDLAYIPQQALTSSSNAVAWDAQAAPNAYHQTSENTTLSAPSNAVEGAFICIEVNFNGSHTFSWNAIYHFSADTAPTTTDTDGKTDIFVFRYNGSIWQEVGRTLNIPES